MKGRFLSVFTGDKRQDPTRPDLNRKRKTTKMYPNEKASLQDSSQIPVPLPKDNGNGPLPSYATAIASAVSSQAFQTRFASVSMHMTDKLRFLHFPDETFNICRQVIHTTWKRGFKEEREYAGSMEIRLKGSPWGGGDSIDSRRLICAMLGALHSQGWVLKQSTNISKQDLHTDTLLFRHQVPSLTECEWCCIGFWNSDIIQLIDGKSFSVFIFTPCYRIRKGFAEQTSNVRQGAKRSSSPRKTLMYLPVGLLHLSIPSRVDRGSSDSFQYRRRYTRT